MSMEETNSITKLINPTCKEAVALMRTDMTSYCINLGVFRERGEKSMDVSEASLRGGDVGLENQEIRKEKLTFFPFLVSECPGFDWRCVTF